MTSGSLAPNASVRFTLTFQKPSGVGHIDYIVTTYSGFLKLYLINCGGGATGSLPGAIGDNVYRGTTSGGEDYAHPVNGSTLVNSPSYTGSPKIMFTNNTGLTTGTEYFYTVTAVYAAGESAPSVEDSDVPDSTAIAWDGRNPGTILSAFRNAYANDAPFISTLRVIGPDNAVYDDGATTGQPPDTLPVGDTNAYLLPDNTTQVLPVGFPEQPAPPANYWPGTYGPTRRVCSIYNFRGVRGDFYLPGWTRNDVRDDAEVHLGSHVNSNTLRSNEGDAGLSWSRTTGWAIFLRTEKGYVQAPAKSGKVNPGQVKATIHPNSAYRFQNGQTVNLVFYAYTNGTEVVNNTRASRDLVLTIAREATDLGFGTEVALGCPLKYDRGQIAKLVMKRIHAIAQTFPHTAASNTRRTGSSWLGVVWGEQSAGTTLDGRGLLLPQGAGANWLPWTTLRTYRVGNPADYNQPYLPDGTFLGFPTANASITWTPNPAVPYQHEFNINISIFPP